MVTAANLALEPRKTQPNLPIRPCRADESTDPAKVSSWAGSGWRSRHIAGGSWTGGFAKLNRRQKSRPEAALRISRSSVERTLPGWESPRSVIPGFSLLKAKGHSPQHDQDWGHGDDYPHRVPKNIE